MSSAPAGPPPAESVPGSAPADPGPGDSPPAAAGPGDSPPAGASDSLPAGPAPGAGPGHPGAGPVAPLADSDDRPGDTEGGTTLHGCPLDRRPGSVVVHCNRDGYLPLMTALKGDDFDLPVGVTGVDYLTHPGRDLPDGISPERFEVVVELLSLSQRKRLRVRCQVPAEDPAVPTLFDLWPGTEAHERETYDMFGIRFDGHPDPSRILMPDDWEGHPLRKDYDTGHIPIQFKEAPK